jgi:transcriptional regulator with XRE-family HTH domain
MGSSRITTITPLRKSFGKAVRSRRLELGLSQEKLAEHSDLHANYVGSVERGERNIGIENIYKIAKALQLHPKNLLP